MDETYDAEEHQGPDGFHRSVMCGEIVAYLAPTGDGVFVDATLGGGGHTEALLRAGAAKMIVLDMDGEALAYVGHNLACFAERLSLRHNNFRDLGDVLREEGVKKIAGAVFDLGLSWHQVRREERGFSYQGDGPLDMRFDPESHTPSALDIIRSRPRNEIERILKEYGEEPRSRTIASEIVQNRKELKTTGDLARLIKRTAGPKDFRKTVMRVFQALRIAVNDELENLRIGLNAALESLEKDGRVAVVSYHSLEDRIVKHIYREKERTGDYRRVNRKPIQPRTEEVERNPAARSAKLRVLEKV
ncbi:16S rRNA (cytosine(1402)-N(4))-methyltransferase RsmH [candidate division WOR-3 bacterium]|nr:16S rRNA (cytosine(1402)-N(4))-methyltransferase RsmH [candidate division WOR-3 bacterium]